MILRSLHVIIEQDVVATCVLEVRGVVDPIESQSDVGGCVGLFYSYSYAYLGAIRDRGVAAFICFELVFTFSMSMRTFSSCLEFGGDIVIL